MPAQEIKPISYGGITLTDATKSSFFLRGHGLHDNSPPEIVRVDRIGVFPSYVRTQPGPGKTYVLSIFPTSDSAAVIDILRPVFDPARQDTPILIVEDENGVQKLCPTVPQGLYYQGGGWWNAPVWAPEPDWVSLAVNTHTVTALADVSQNFTPAIVNDGDGVAFPHTIRVAPQAKKTAWGGWQKMWELTFAWRSEFPATSPGSGSWLLDVTDGGINTSTIVDVSAITTTCTTTITSSQAMSRGAPFSLTVGSTAGWDTKGILLTTDTEEQFEYEVIDATHIDVSARALGGTAAVLHTATFTIHQSRMLKDGRDIAVFINNVQVPPEKVNLKGIDTATTKIWVEFSQGPGSQAVLEDVGDGTGAETKFVIDREKPDWRVGDYLVLDSSAADEQWRISAIDGLNLTVVRGVRNTSGSSLGKFDVLWKVDIHFQVAYNSTVAVERPANPDPPLIDLALSTNLQWEWTTAPIWSGSSRSAGAWTRSIYSGPAAIASRLAAKIGLDVTGSSIRFTDTRPTALKPNFDCVGFQSACGIAASAGAIEYDAVLPWNMALEVIGKDLAGIDHLIERRHGHESGDFHGPVTYTDRQETPADILSSVLLRCRNMVVTGNAISDEPTSDEPLGGPTEGPSGSSEVDWQTFVLDEPTKIEDIVVRTRKHASGTTKTVALRIRATNSGNPDPDDAAAASLINPSGWQGIAATSFSTTFGELSFFLTNEVVLPAGTYAIAYWYDGAGTNEVYWALNHEPVFSRGSKWERVGGTVTQSLEDDFWFGVLSADVDNQAEVKGETGEVLTIDDIKVVFDTARVPMVAKQSNEDAYYMDTSIKRATLNEMRIRFLDRWADMDGFSVNINTVTRIAVVSRYIDAIRSILTTQTDNWMTIPSGSVTISAVPNLEAEDEDLTLLFRDLWQA